MKFDDVWQTLPNPMLATMIAVAIASAVTAGLAVPVVRTAKKVGHYKPQSLLLLAVPVMIVAAGAWVDDLREAHHYRHLDDAGITAQSWEALTEELHNRYQVGQITPATDQAETLTHITHTVNGEQGTLNTTPLVEVQMPDSTTTQIYQLHVETSSLGGGRSYILQQQPADARSGTGIDPEGLKYYSALHH